ncbi:MAG: UPF0280 family protein [Desulfitobacteriaceae bacterium]|nr:UPF0280 family protein [Desulfitobacteriaceae bacterium]
MCVDRKYRANLITDLETLEVTVKETDIFISVSQGKVNEMMRDKIYRQVTMLRNELEEYLKSDPEFGRTLSPYIVRHNAPYIVWEMAKRANQAGVGPMAAVAGAFAELVGKYIGEQFSREVIVENGGDIYLSSQKQRVIGIFAGESPFSNQLGIKINPHKTPLGICTSSGKIGPSLSLGRADAAVILADSTFLADAVATAAGNRINSPQDFQGTIQYAKKISGVKGVLLIKGDKMAAWGDIELVPLPNRG